MQIRGQIIRAESGIGESTQLQQTEQDPSKSVSQMLTQIHGYMDLGMFGDANDAVESLPPEIKATPEVLSLRVEIFRALVSWELMREVAGHLARMNRVEPKHWLNLACATRRCRDLKAAEAVLLESLKRHVGVAVIHFNLACYCAQMGELDKARFRLLEAYTLDGNFMRLAVRDPDLEPLWKELGKVGY